MRKIHTALLIICLFLLLSGEINPKVLAVFSSPFLEVDHFENDSQTATVTLTNDRIRTHRWKYTLSDESVLSCIGTEIHGRSTDFIFSGLAPGICDVVFEYRRETSANQPALITEVYRFYVNDTLNVTCEHLYFHSNES